MRETEKNMKINNIDVFWDNLEPYYNIIQTNFGSRSRSFCRCGAVYTKGMWRCPQCGKGGLWYNSRYSLTSPSIKIPSFVSMPDGFNIVNDVYEIEENPTTFELDVVKKTSAEVLFKKTSSGVEYNFEYSPLYSGWGKMNLYNLLKDLSLIKIDFEYLKKNDSSYFPEFENFDFKTFFSTQKLNNTKNYYYPWTENLDISLDDNKSGQYILYCFLKKLFSWFGKGNNHEAFLGFAITNVVDGKGSTSTSHYKSFEQLTDSFGIPKDFYKFIDNVWFYSNIYYNTNSSHYDKLSKDYQKFILDVIDHYHFDFKTAEELAKDFYLYSGKSAELGTTISTVFEKYCKDNIVSYQGKVVTKFLEDCNELKIRKKAITSDNLRDLPLIKNNEMFEDMGYDSGRIKIFLESFFDNPIKASYYLKSKKALTKKEIQEFLDIQTR